MDFTIEIITDPGEAVELAGIEQKCFSRPLEPDQITSLLKQNTNCWFAARGNENGKIAGSLWMQTVLDEGYIGNVAVHPDYRRQGIADALLDEVDRHAIQKQLAFVTLEVRAGNVPAVALYKKHGYEKVGRRPHYYTDPAEDALLMTKEYEKKAL